MACLSNLPAFTSYLSPGLFNNLKNLTKINTPCLFFLSSIYKLYHTNVPCGSHHNILSWWLMFLVWDTFYGDALPNDLPHITLRAFYAKKHELRVTQRVYRAGLHHHVDWNTPTCWAQSLQRSICSMNIINCFTNWFFFFFKQKSDGSEIWLISVTLRISYYPDYLVLCFTTDKQRAFVTPHERNTTTQNTKRTELLRATCLFL